MQVYKVKMSYKANVEVIVEADSKSKALEKALNYNFTDDMGESPVGKGFNIESIQEVTVG